MQINISGHHVDMTEALKSYVERRFSNKLKKHQKRITNVHVTLHCEERFHQKAEAEVHAKGGPFFATDSTDDMYASIDSIVDKLDRQMIKHKEMNHNHSDGEIH